MQGLQNAVAEIFPVAEVRACVRHLLNNLKAREGCNSKVLKDLLWKAARATTMREYDQAMAEIEATKSEAKTFLLVKDPNTWSKSHFSPLAQTDMLLNNLYESWNKVNVHMLNKLSSIALHLNCLYLICFVLHLQVIKGARDKPVLTSAESIRTTIMNTIVKKRDLAMKFTGPICPKIQRKVDESIKGTTR